MEAHEEPESINRPEFRAVFHAHHVPQGVIKLKKEFQDLKQGPMSVNEYVTKFTQLSCYTLHEVDTDEKKQECFLNGLNDGLTYALVDRVSYPVFRPKPSTHCMMTQDQLFHTYDQKCSQITKCHE
jgi:hypothetical protein